MTTILIADTSKPSLVMTSEVFKDKIPGAIVLVAKTGQETLEILKEKTPDMCVVDFDLPDSDGISLVTAMRETFKGPILLTAYPDKIVDEAVTNHLFGFADAGGWLAKPIKVPELNLKIDKFLLEKHRLGRRFTINMLTQLIGKGAGRGKRSPKVKGKVVNISMGGVCVALDKPMVAIKSAEEITLAIALPAEAAPTKAITKEVAAPVAAKKTKTLKGASAKNAASKKKPEPARKTEENKIRATVAWVRKGGTLAGIQFGRLTPVQKKGLENLIKEMATTETTV